ncbi:MAG: hypothetical protein WDZ63_13835 [Burkholderiales bacterium]
MRLRSLLLVTAFAAGSGPIATAEDGEWAADVSAPTLQPEDVISEFSQFAGSERNAERLVEALRLGGETVLVDRDGTVVRFDTQTGPLGYGNVAVALSLAQTLLVSHGILDPHAADVAAALVGGELPVDGDWIEVDGVLKLRERGLSWSDVAVELGFSLGDAVSVAGSSDADLRTELASRRARRDVEIVDHSISAERSTRIERPARVERPGK